MKNFYTPLLKVFAAPQLARAAAVFFVGFLMMSGAQAQTVVNKRLYLKNGSTLSRVLPTNDPGFSSSVPLVKQVAALAGTTTSTVSANNPGASTGISFSRTIVAGDNRILMVGISTGNEATVSGVTYGGAALTRLANVAQGTSGASVTAEIWYLKNPPVGTANVVVSWPSAAMSYAIGAVQYNNVNLTETFGTVYTNAFTTATNSISFNVTNTGGGDIVFDVVAINTTQGGSTITNNASQTINYNASANKFVGGSSTKAATPPTTTMAWTSNRTAPWAAAAVALKGNSNQISFALDPSFCGAFTVKAGQNLTLFTHATVTAGNCGTPTLPFIATLRRGSDIIGTQIIANNSGLAGENTTGTLTWTGPVGADFTFNPGDVLTLDLRHDCNNSTIVLDYDGVTKTSYLQLPTETFINVNNITVHKQPYPLVDPVATKVVGEKVYVRMVVSNPFGFDDITGLNLNITGPAGSNVAATSVATSGCTRIYEYEWENNSVGTYNIAATAKAGSETGAQEITHTTTLSNFEVTAPASAPIAIADNFCLTSASTAVLNVLGNDTQEPLFAGTPDFLSAASPANYTLTIQSGPALGSATVNGTNNTIDFNPAGGTAMQENDVTTFTYRITENSGGLFADGVVTIRYSTANDAPVINDDVALTTTGRSVNIPVLANDSDADGGLGTPTIATQPNFGTIVLNPDNTITYTPFAGFEGQDVFTYEVCDIPTCGFTAICTTATVTVNVVFAYNVCQEGNSTLNIAAIPGADGYKWSFPAGVVITSAHTGFDQFPTTITPSIDVDWSNVGTGQYTVCVEPTNECGFGAGECVEVVVSRLLLNAVPTNVSCKNAENGSVLLNVSGGLAPYTYAWTKDGDPTFTATVKDPGGLAPGTYNVLVTDQTGCENTTSVVITEPAAVLAISNVSVTDANPFNTANGAIDITVAGGTGPYTYVWSNTATTEDLNGVVAGFYSVMVTDANGCTITQQITVNGVGAPLDAVLTGTNVNCFGGATGAIDLQVLGGSGSYTYAWTASNGGAVPSGQAAGQDLTGLVAGTYEVTVNDGTNNLVRSIAITQPAAALSATATAVPLSCFANGSGAVTLNVTGGTAPYTYLWNNGSNAAQLTDVGAGTYSVTVTDANGCTTTANATVTQPAALTATSVVLNESCNPGNNGSIGITPAGGSGGYTYLWSNGETTSSITGLAAGVYSVTVTDANGCKISEIFTVRNACITVTENVITGPINNGDGTYTLTYQILVSNTGTTALNNVQLTNDLSATFGSYAVLSTTSPNFSLEAAYTGTGTNTSLLSTSQTLLPGETGRVNITVLVTPGTFSNPYNNFVEAVGTDATSRSVTASDDVDVTFTEQPLVGVSKSIVSGPINNGDGSYDITFGFEVRNYGDITLANIQVEEDFEALFGAGNYIVLGVTASNGLTANNGFNGNTDKNLLAGTDALAINGFGTASVTIRVTPVNAGPFTNQVTASANGLGGTATTDASQNGNNPDPDNDGNPSNNSDGTPINFPENPEIGAAKRIVGTPINNNDGSYSLTYEIRVRNSGDVNLVNVQIEEDLSTTFAGATVVAATPASAGFVVNPLFDGVGNNNLLDAGNTLLADQTKIITLQVTVIPGGNLGPYNNQVLASGESPFGTVTTDLSNNGIDINPDNTDPNNHSAVTPVTFTEAPLVGAALTVSNVVNNNDNTYTVTYNLAIENMGNVPLENLLANLDLQATFGTAVNYAVVSLTSSTLDVNPSFDGNSDKALLLGSDALAYQTTENLTLVVLVTPGSKLGIYNASTTVTAEGPGGTSISDVSQNGTNPDPDNDNNPGNNNAPTPLTFTESPLLGAAKEVVGSISESPTGTFNVTYDILIENMSGTGATHLSDIQVVDDLSETFAGTASFSVTSLAIQTQPANTTLTVSNSYNGSTDITLLSGSNSLLVGEFVVIRLTVAVTPGAGGAGGPFPNFAIATGVSPGGRLVSDFSTDGADVDPNNNNTPSDDNEPTIVIFTDNPSIGIAKFLNVVRPVSPFRNFVQFGLVVTNTGTVALSNLQVFDDILTQFAGLNPSNFATSDGDILGTTQNWNGTASSNILEPGQELLFGETDTIYIEFLVDAAGTPVNNSAEASGKGPLLTSATVTDDSQVGKDPDPDSDGDPTNNDDPTPVYFRMLTNPDVNVTYVDVSISGDLKTNDYFITGFTYSNPTAEAGNPSAAMPVLSPNGTYSFSAAVEGVYHFTVEICADGQTTSCATERLTITVLDANISNNPPVANTDIATTLQGQPVTLQTLANDHPGNTGLTLEPATVRIISAPNEATQGTVTNIDASGNITFTPIAEFVGTAVFTYEVCDNATPANCAVGYQYVTVFPTGTANTTLAADDYAFTGRGVQVSGNLLNNDTDPEGHTQTVTPINLSIPGQGTLVVDANGTYTFTPSGDYLGPINFEYTVCDDQTPAACASATLYVLIGEQKTMPDMHATYVDVAITGNVQTNDLTLPGSTYGSPVAVGTNPSADAPVFAAGSLGTYTFETSVPGVYVFDVTACAPGQTTGCLVERLTITVLDYAASNNSPVANPDFAVMQGYDSPNPATSVTIDVRANDAAGNLNGTLSIPILQISNPALSAPSNGSVSVDPGTGLITYIPNSGFYGDDSFEYEVCDATHCVTQTVLVTVVPASAGTTLVATDDYAVTNKGVTVTVNDPAAGVLNNDATTGLTADLRVSIVGGIDATDPDSTRLAVAGVGILVMHKEEGTYQFYPDANFEGTATFPYTLCDGSNCVSATLYIQVGPERTLTIVAVAPSCDADVPYLTYTLETNFDPRGLPIEFVWATGTQAPGIDVGSPVVPLVPTVTQTITPAANDWTFAAGVYTYAGENLWPGATVDGSGNPTDWPGWVLDGGNWFYREDGFSGYRTIPSVAISINPDASIGAGTITYPDPTPSCFAGPANSIAGTVWNDVNGSGATGAIQNGSEVGTQAAGLSVVLIGPDPTDPAKEIVFAITTVAANGTYEFLDVPRLSTYKMVLTANANGLAVNDVVADPAAVANISTGWQFTAPALRTSIDNLDGAGLTGVDFGVQELPTSGVPADPGFITTTLTGNRLVDAVYNRGTFGGLEIPAAAIGAQDPDGTAVGVRITQLTNNILSITVGDSTFYRNPADVPGTGCPTTYCVALGDGAYVPVDANGNPSVAITIATVDGYVDSDFPNAGEDLEITYQSYDNAGAFSASSTTLEIEVVALKFQNGVWHNGSGNLGSDVNNDLTYMPDEDDSDKTLFWIDNGGTLGKTAVVQNLIVYENVEGDLAPGVCLTVLGEADTRNNAKLNMRAQTDLLYAQYLGPKINGTFEMILERGYHNIGFPVDITLEEWADQNNSTANPQVVYLNGVEGEQNLMWYDSHTSGGEEQGFFINRTDRTDTANMLYHSHAYGIWNMALETERTTSYGYNYFLSEVYAPLTGTPKPSYTIKATGQLNDESFSYPTSDNFGGWNLVPNVYPVTISTDLMEQNGFFDDSNGDPFLDRAVWVWDPNDSYLTPLTGRFSRGAYRAVDAITGSSLGQRAGRDQNDPNSQLVDAGENIAPMQAFYVRRITGGLSRRQNASGGGAVNHQLPSKARGVRGQGVDEQANGTLVNAVMKPEYRVSCINKEHYKTAAQPDVIVLETEEVATGAADMLQLVFDNDYTEGLDPGWDIFKQGTVNADLPMTFTIVDGRPVVSNKLPYPTTESYVPMGFYSEKDGVFYAVKMVKDPGYYTVYLEDLKTGNWHDLTQGDYTFKNDVRDEVERFRIHFKMGNTQMDAFKPSAKAWAVEEGIKVRFHNIFSGTARVRITDAAGRLLYNNGQVNTAEDFVYPILDKKPGLYIVTIISDDLVTAEKVVR